MHLDWGHSSTVKIHIYFPVLQYNCRLMHQQCAAVQLTVMRFSRRLYSLDVYVETSMALQYCPGVPAPAASRHVNPFTQIPGLFLPKIFRSQERIVPMGTFRSWELSFSGNESSLEFRSSDHSFPGTFVSRNFRFEELSFLWLFYKALAVNHRQL